MSSKKKYSLGKAERLKSRKQIDLLFESGKKLNIFPFRLMYRAEPGTGEIRTGFTVSSKNFPRAVDRNRIRRITREAYRLQRNGLEAVILENKTLLHLFLIYTAKEILPYTEIASGLKQALEKLTLLHANGPKNS